MKRELSILIPTFNDVCKHVVNELQRQASQIEGLSYEIVVADDGSTEAEAISANEAINLLSHCRYIVRKENVGRAAIRNFLASIAAYDWLLFIDSGMSIGNDEYLKRYLETEADVVCGGYRLTDDERMNNNLRYRYEKAAQASLSQKNREAAPYQNFHTSNFLMARSQYLAHPLDTRFRRYGYEDVLMGKQLQLAGIGIEHIDNPVLFDRFDSNERFVEKTEEALQTLHEFADDLSGYSRMLDVAATLRKWHLASPYLFIYNSMKKSWRNNLCGRTPSILQLKLYKLGYYLSL